MRRLVLRPEARLDIREAALWYDEQSPGLGDRFTEDLDVLFERILVAPLQFPEIEPPVRCALPKRFPYKVYFRLGPTTARILAVMHQSRHPDTWRSRTSR
jgi:toxin ParE1/3/4